MSKLYDRIESLCENQKISITTMCRDSGVSRGSLTDLKHGRIKGLSAESIKKIADYFKISADYLLQDELKEKAIEKFGFCWDYKEREKLKADARNSRDENNLSENEIIETFVTEFKALFSRSLEASGYNSNHVNFKDYVAMLLNQEQWHTKCNNYGKQVYSRLVNMYGKLPGIPSGTLYLDYNKIIHTSNEDLKNNKISSNTLKFALWGDADVDDELLDDVKRYALVARQMRENKKKE